MYLTFGATLAMKRFLVIMMLMKIIMPTSSLNVPSVEPGYLDINDSPDAYYSDLPEMDIPGTFKRASSRRAVFWVIGKHI